MKKIIKVVLVFSICLLSAVIAFTSLATKVSAVEYEANNNYLIDSGYIFEGIYCNENNRYMWVSSSEISESTRIKITTEFDGYIVEVDDDFGYYLNSSDIVQIDPHSSYFEDWWFASHHINKLVNAGYFFYEVNGGYSMPPIWIAKFLKVENLSFQTTIKMFQKEHLDAMIYFVDGLYNDGYIVGYNDGYNKALELAEDDIATAYRDGYDAGHAVGRSAGYKEGYRQGQSESIGTNWLTAAVSSISQVLNIQIFGSITIATLVFFPLLVSLIFFILRLIGGRG